MVAKLSYNRGTEAREISCASVLTIGRVPPNEIVIPHPKVSRNHAMIRMLQPGEYYLIDIGSTNGTLLNGQRIVVPMLLKDGDAISIEDCVLIFHAPLVPAPEAGEGADDDGGAEMTII
jgi:adenylate cyclase